MSPNYTSFRVSAKGRLTPIAGSTVSADPKSSPTHAYAVFAPGFDPAKEFALGVVAHPKRPILYISMPTVPSLAVYDYNQRGELTFVKSVPNAGAYLPCWNVITPDGRWLYTANADTNNVTVFDVGTDPQLRARSRRSASRRQATRGTRSSTPTAGSCSSTRRVTRSRCPRARATPST